MRCTGWASSGGLFAGSSLSIPLTTRENTCPLLLFLWFDWAYYPEITGLVNSGGVHVFLRRVEQCLYTALVSLLLTH